MKFENDVLYLLVNSYQSGIPVVEKTGVDKKAIWKEYKQRKVNNPNLCIKIVRLNECPEYVGESQFEKDEVMIRDFKTSFNSASGFYWVDVSIIGRKKDGRIFVNIQYCGVDDQKKMLIIDDKRIDVPVDEIERNIEVAALYCFDLFMRVHDDIKSEVVLKANGKEIKRYNKQSNK